jgi:hypothetical protein
VDRRILRLGRALRESGAPVSTPEILDAARAALSVGVGRRGDLQAALRAALVKSGEFVGAYEEHFERLFPARIPRPPSRARGGRATGESREPAIPGRAARQVPGAPGRVGAQTPETGGGTPPGRERREGGDGLPSAPATPVSDGTDRSRVDVEAPPDAGVGALRRAPEPPADERTAEAVGRAGAQRCGLLAKGFRERWSAAEEREAAAAMEELARRLATRLARRRRRSRLGAVDLAATLRANLVHGGVPFVLRRRARARARRDLVLLADVSGSVRRASSLFLLILGRLRDRFTGVRTFAYVDRPAEIPSSLAARPAAEIAAALADLLPLDALSDHGETLRRFNRDFARAGGGRSVVVILGDARNNRFPALEWELEDIRRRCHRLVWIVPEPKSLWGSGDSAIAAYAPHCHAVIAAPDPAALASAAKRLLTITKGL